MTETDRLKYLRFALLFGGRDLRRRNLSTNHHLAIRLVMAHRPVSVLADDSWDLRDARCVPDHCFSRGWVVASRPSACQMI